MAIDRIFPTEKFVKKHLCEQKKRQMFYDTCFLLKLCFMMHSNFLKMRTIIHPRLFFIYGFLRSPFSQLYIAYTHVRAREFLFLFDRFAC